MSSSDSPLSIPFPYPPYPVQSDLMTFIYSCINTSKIGIFESPTGTGKSLSIICSSVYWLLEKEEEVVYERYEEMWRREKKDGESSSSIESGKDLPSWINVQSNNNKVKDIQNLITIYREKENNLNSRLLKNINLSDIKLGKRSSKFTPSTTDIKDNLDKDKSAKKDDIEKDEFLLDNTDISYLSDDDDIYSDKSKQDEFIRWPQIIYCSRTHSQLTQFVNEIKKTEFNDKIKVVTLGSRKQLCVNPELIGKPLAILNDRCLDMQKNKPKPSTKKSAFNVFASVSKAIHKEEETNILSKCPFLSYSSQNFLRDTILQKVRDIEEIHEIGKENGICGYFASRAAVSAAHVIAMPYASLLNKSTRDSLGVNIEGNVVIIDEAHNIMEAMNEAHSITITIDELDRSEKQLSRYIETYSKKLTYTNLTNANKVLDLLAKFLKHMSNLVEVSKKSNYSASVFTLNDFTIDIKCELINLHHVVDWIENSNICKKVMVIGTTVKHISDLNKFKSFLIALNEKNDDGRVIVYPSPDKMASSFRYIMLNPGIHFVEVLRSARSVLFCGGTMQPFNYYISQLLNSDPIGKTIDAKIHSAEINKLPSLDSRIMTFSCGHVVNPNNVLPLVVSTSPNGRTLIFTKENRSHIIKDLGSVIENLVKMVPAGVVCFFQSFSYEEEVYKVWKDTGLIDRLEAYKKLFRENRSSTGDEILSEYSNVINAGKGALLFSIVGGKMSEGINFSNDMARCVVLVGLPYANKGECELKEKMNYYDRKLADANARKLLNPSTITKDLMAGNTYYENLCFRAINQSIGRAIRHRNDWASIVLVDARFKEEKKYNLLPGWIKSRLEIPKSFDDTIDKLKQFFNQMKCV